MVGQGGQQFQNLAGGGMDQPQPAGVQMHLAADVAAQLRPPAVAQIFLPRPAIFAITNDRVAQFGHMGAQLVGAAGDRFQRHPGGAAAKRRQHGIIGMGAFGAFGLVHLGGVDAAHLFAFATVAMATGLDQPVFDRPHLGVRHPGNHRPIDFSGFARPERGGQRRSGGTAARQHQNARGILVQPVHQPGPFFQPEFQRLGQTINMFGGAGAALRRQPRRLVQHNDVIVAVDHCTLNHLGIGGIDPGGCLFRFRLHHRQWRQPHLLADLDPGRRLDPRAVHPDFAGATGFLDPALIDMWKVPLQPAVEPLVAVAGRYRDGVCAHAPIPRPKAKPATTATNARPTDAAT